MSRAPWEAERPTSAEDARRRIRHSCTGIAAATVAPFGQGWDNTAFLVDDEWVFRFPRREIAVKLLEVEATALPVLARRLPLSVPIPEHIGQDEANWPFAGYRLLRGRTLCAVAPDDDAMDWSAAAASMGEFLRALHETPADLLELPIDELRRAHLAEKVAVIEPRTAVLVERGVIAEAAPWLDLLANAPPASDERTVCHGDLYARHIVVADGAFSGVIDWGDLHLGDRGVDLAVLFQLFPPEARSAFAASYGDIDARTLRLARARAAWHAANVCWFALDIDDHDLLRWGRAVLERTRVG